MRSLTENTSTVSIHGAFEINGKCVGVPSKDGDILFDRGCTIGAKSPVLPCLAALVFASNGFHRPTATQFPYLASSQSTYLRRFEF